MDTENTIYIIYDGECPFCSDYVKAMRLKKVSDKLVLINARTESYQHLTHHQSFNINEGMLVIFNNQFYHQADAVHILSLIATPLSTLNRINFLLFKNPHIAKIYYPVCRFIRNLALKVKGVPPINK